VAGLEGEMSDRTTQNRIVYDIYRLSARIWDLRNGLLDGVRYSIKTFNTRSKSGKRYAEYLLLG
jgi:hypothetical protein